MTAMPHLLPALITQMLHRKMMRANDIADEKRRARLELMLVALLAENMPLQTLKKSAGCSDSTARDDAGVLIGDGMVKTWTARSPRSNNVIRWYGLTDSGVARAKQLKEMEQ